MSRRLHRARTAARCLAMFAALGITTCLGQVKFGAVDQARLLAADLQPDQWLTTGGGFGETHYSGLQAINASNVAHLGYAWGFETGTQRGLEATPIVVDGVMYTSGVAGRVYALNAATGQLLWRFEPKIDPRVYRSVCCDSVNRGVAAWQGRIYVAALDGVLYALDAASGKAVWSADTIIDRSRGYASTGAPQVADKVVVIGNAGGEYDTRGYISAYDLRTGRLAWRFFTVPRGPGQPQESAALKKAAKTWARNSRWDIGGGGNVWGDMAYDPRLELLYVATGNGAPYGHTRRSPGGGDNLFVASVLAIHPDSGRLAWYYQETPGDQWDYDSDAPMVLTTLKIKGRARNVLLHAPKNGFFYIFDRETGQLLSAKASVPVTWARGVDLNTGRPRKNPLAAYGAKPASFAPGNWGGHDWNAMAFDPQTQLVYLPTTTGDLTFENTADATLHRGLLNMEIEVAAPPSGAAPAAQASYLSAWDPIAQRRVWQVPTAQFWDRAGVLATAGGLVFQGSADGHFRAFDARTGKVLDDIDTGTSMVAAPMSYSIQGVQYVAIMAAWGGAGWWIPNPAFAAFNYGNEGRILVFRLGGRRTPMPRPLPPIETVPVPPPQTASATEVARGEALFDSDCAVCHINLPRGGTPDLTRLPAAIHASFDKIVLGGLLKDDGMPQWDDVLSRDDAHAIHAYLIKASWEAYRAQQKTKAK
jgi:quinohemoprotein ethanol dehydrogenase